VVHEVAPAGDRPHRHAQRLEHVRLGARGRREERAVPVVGRPLVLVERDPHAHAAGRGGADRVRHPVADGAGQPHVVECEDERRARRRDPVHDALGDGLGGLAAVGVHSHIQHGRGQYPGR
jgi:hypothetical protein